MTVELAILQSLVVVVSLSAGSADLPDPVAPNAKPHAVFETTKIWPVHITIAAKEFQAMQPVGGFAGFDFFKAKKKTEEKKPDEPAREKHRNMFGMDLPWATGSIVIGNESYENVGIRYKGNGTIGDAGRTIKKSFKIDLDYFGGTGRFHGLKTLNLHCGVADPSRCRETLGYEIYRDAGVPAPRTALAEVWLTVPGKYEKELLGIYTLVEHVEKAFLREHFGSETGLLMKPEGVRDLEFRGESWTAYQKLLNAKREPTADEVKRIVAFFKLIHRGDDATFRKEIAQYVDIEQYLRYLATTSFISNSDSFFGLGHNYFIYLHPKTGRFHFMPWDLDRAFANLPILGSNNQLMNLSLVKPYAGKHRLTERLLEMPAVAEQYQKLLVDLSKTAFEKERLLKEVERLRQATADLDARTTKAALARREPVGPPPMFAPPPPLVKFVERRTASVAAQLAGTSKGHIPSGGFGGVKVGDMYGDVILEELDTNKDGKLSKDEWLATAKRLFSLCTSDEEGRVAEKGVAEGLVKMLPKPAEGMGSPPGGFGPANFMAGPIVRRADTNQDGKVTQPELLTAATKIFEEFDRGSSQLDESTFCTMLNVLFPPPNFGAPKAAAKK